MLNLYTLSHLMISVLLIPLPIAPNTNLLIPLPIAPNTNTNPNDPLDQSRQILNTWQKGTDTKEAGKRLRTMVMNDESIFEAMTMLIDMQSKLRSEYIDAFPNLVVKEINSLEYRDEMEKERSLSAGLSYVQQGEIDKGIDALIREAWLLSTSAIIKLKIAVWYDIEGWPVLDKRIIDFFHEYADEGFPRGQYIYGKLLLRIPDADKENAIRYLNDSVFPEAYMSAYQYALDNDDLTNGLKYLRKAADLADPTALFELGIYAQEEGDHKSMTKYFEMTLDADPEFYAAQLELGRAYIEGMGLEEDEERGVNMILELVDTPDKKLAAIACLNMAVFHVKGIGVEKSIKEAQGYIHKVRELDFMVPPAILEMVDSAK